MKKKESPKNVEWQIKEISKQLNKMQDHLHFLTNEVKKQGNIQIHEMNLHHPQLENLTYQLDHLEIKEVSGTLNFGNNFGLETLTKRKGKNEWAFSKWFPMFEEKVQDESNRDQTKKGCRSSEQVNKPKEAINLSSTSIAYSSIEKREYGYRVKINQ